jgi:hypothetical protein
MYLRPWDIVNGYSTTMAPPVPIKQEPGIAPNTMVTTDGESVVVSVEGLLGVPLTHIVVCSCATNRTVLECASRINFQPQ